MWMGGLRPMGGLPGLVGGLKSVEETMRYSILGTEFPLRCELLSPLIIVSGISPCPHSPVPRISSTLLFLGSEIAL